MISSIVANLSQSKIETKSMKKLYLKNRDIAKKN